MFERIVVALGDTPGAAEVVPFASALARRCQATMKVVPLEDLSSVRTPELVTNASRAATWTAGAPPVHAPEYAGSDELGSALVVLGEAGARAKERSNES